MLTQEQIEKGNALIAQYMGLTYHPKTDEWTYVHPIDGDAVIWSEYLLPYSELWNWVMPIVEKIEAELPEGYNITIEHRSCYVEHPGISFSATGDTKIEAVFRAISEYLTWRDEQTK